MDGSQSTTFAVPSRPGTAAPVSVYAQALTIFPKAMRPKTSLNLGESFELPGRSMGRIELGANWHRGASAALSTSRSVTLLDVNHQAPHSESAADKPSETKAFPQPPSAPPNFHQQAVPLVAVDMAARNL